MTKSVTLIDQVASDAYLEEAYRWLCEQRKESGPNNDVWHLRFHWKRMKSEIKQTLLSDTYHLSPLNRWKIDGQNFESWEASDSIVLKSIQLVLFTLLQAKMLMSCTNIKGHGGLKQAVNKIQAALPDYQFAFKSDIKRYYTSIKHQLLLKSLQTVISDKTILRLVREYCKRLVWVKGEYERVRMGIPLGCSLSPLMGAWFLQDIDQVMSKHQDCFYIRYMDDWVILTNGMKCLEIAVQTIDNHIQKLKALYRSNTPMALISAYKKRWLLWVNAGINSIIDGIRTKNQTRLSSAQGPP